MGNFDGVIEGTRPSMFLSTLLSHCALCSIEPTHDEVKELFYCLSSYMHTEYSFTAITSDCAIADANEEFFMGDGDEGFLKFLDFLGKRFDIETYSGNTKEERIRLMLKNNRTECRSIMKKRII